MKIGRVHTSVSTGSNGIVTVTYHATPVVVWDKIAGRVVLDSGGYRTPTTKRRMNQASEHFGLGFRVFAKRGVWYVVTESGDTVLFEDGMSIKI